MSSGRDPVLVFLERARGYLQILKDEAQPKDLRVQAAQNLAGSAHMAGIGVVTAAASELLRLLTQGRPLGDALAQVAALVDASAATAADSSSSLVTGAEVDLLRQLFLDEAQERLELITATLAELGREPSRRTWVDELLRLTHTLKGSAATIGLHHVSEAAHRLEDVFAQLRSGRATPRPAMLEALTAATDTLRAIVDAQEPRVALGLGDRLRSELAFALALGQGAVEGETQGVPVPISDSETGPDFADSSGIALDDGETDDPQALLARPRDELNLLRVDAKRVDALMDSVGELVFDRTRIERRVQELRAVARELGKTRTALRATLGPLRAPPSPEAVTAQSQSMPSRIAEIEEELAERVANLNRTTAALLEDTDVLRRTAASLQAGLTQIRMMSVRWLFQRLARPLRDMARRAGKRVELTTLGEETELDKTVVEQIADPLVQILRNAVAHGIESSDARQGRGKIPMGRITLSARHQGDSVFLEVADDGAGIDTAKIRSLLLSSGRLSELEAAAISDERLIHTIFEPGVSTREAPDELAGRGVGLDMVRERIARLGGEISVTSTPDVGTCFTIRLPLTTAITQALLFKVGGQVYALPNTHVLDATHLEVSGPALPSLVRVGNDDVPLVVLHQLLDAERPDDARRVAAVVLDFAGRRLAVTCDKVIGPREIVVKSLGPLLAPLPLFAGATISGAGKVQLILDPATLAQAAYPQKEAVQAAQAAPQPATTGDTGAVPVVRARVLIADDSRSVREFLCRSLASAGYVVDTAVDGGHAWEMLQDVHYDALVTDLEMPRLAGHELIERVRSSTALAALPVVIISAQGGEGGRLRAEVLGANAFLPKPVTQQAIVTRLADLLRRG